MAAPVPDHPEQSCATLEERLAAAEADVARLSRELAEAREQQTATAEVLRVIATSPTDVQRVLDAVAERAYRLCRASSSSIYLVESDQLRVVAAAFAPTTVPNPPGTPGAVGYVSPIILENMSGRTVLEGRVIHIADAHDTATRAEYPAAATFDATARSRLHVPLRRDGIAIGLLAVRRHPRAPFSASEIALMETFADQAVIAIENARLFQELEQRNRELTESLEQQTATADILSLIAGSPTDPQPVLDAIVQSAARLSDSSDVILGIRDGDQVRIVAEVATFEHSAQVGESVPIAQDRPSTPAMLDRRTVHIPDRSDPAVRSAFADGAFRTPGSSLSVPLVREGEAIGILQLRRLDPQPYSDREIALVETFADQAAIAIENARLFEELEQRNRDLTAALDQQTATAEVLRVIAASPTDLVVVLNAITESTVQLTAAYASVVWRVDGEVLRGTAGCRAGAPLSPDELREFQEEVRPLSPRVGAARAVLEARTIRIDDAAVEDSISSSADFQRRHGFRSIVLTPLLSDGVAIGVLTASRHEVRPFDDREVALLETFADQAVIAIENARLFSELEQRNRDLTAALDQQNATADILRVIATSPTDFQPVLDAITDSARRLSQSTLAAICIREADQLRAVTIQGGPSAVRVGELMPISVGRQTGRALLERRTIHTPDRSAPEARAANPGMSDAGATLRASLAVPLIRESEAIGVLVLDRDRAVPYDPREIALLETFADQAVIAIENARLFQELADLNRTLEARVSEQVDQLERVGRLRRYLSPQLAEMIVSSGDESILASHRRQITVVFCDLRGFTAFAETAEPEEVMAVLSEYHAAMGELIREHEGTFGHFAGDGLMIFFNDPLPQPDHVERAVRMACAMRERAAELARGWRRAGYELDFGVGIAVGYATLGRIGFEGRYDYDVIGTVANLAARLCAEASGGQILIPARLHGMIEDLIEAEPVGELTLKGLHRPVAAFNIAGLHDDDSPAPDQATEQAARDA